MTALFAFNDVIALGAMRALRDSGIEVPNEVAVLGCDDIEAARYAMIGLSTMRIPKYEMGARAADIILQGIRGTLTDRMNAVLEAELVERESTGPLEATGPLDRPREDQLQVKPGARID